MSAFAPQKSISSIPVHPAVALKYIQKYLEESKTSPYLLPNARLEPSGPTAGSSANNVTINNLERVEAGLRGEWLAPKFGFGEVEDAPAPAVVEEVEVEGWQDKSEFEREQSDVEGDLTPENTVLAQGDEELVNAIEANVPKSKRKFDGDGDGDGEGEGKEGDKKARKEQNKFAGGDKQSRKAEKKARKKEEQKRKLEEAAKKRAAEEE